MVIAVRDEFQAAPLHVIDVDVSSVEDPPVAHNYTFTVPVNELADGGVDPGVNLIGVDAEEGTNVTFVIYPEDDFWRLTQKAVLTLVDETDPSKTR